jgi:hypothetical protein
MIGANLEHDTKVWERGGAQPLGHRLAYTSKCMPNGTATLALTTPGWNLDTPEKCGVAAARRSTGPEQHGHLQLLTGTHHPG